MRNNDGQTFIDIFYNVLFEPELCDQLFSIITLINSGNT